MKAKRQSKDQIIEAQKEEIFSLAAINSEIFAKLDNARAQLDEIHPVGVAFGRWLSGITKRKEAFFSKLRRSLAELRRRTVLAATVFVKGHV